MIYTHVLKLGGGAVRSPLDALRAALPDVQRWQLDANAAAPAARVAASGSVRGVNASGGGSDGSLVSGTGRSVPRVRMPWVAYVVSRQPLPALATAAPGR